MESHYFFIYSESFNTYVSAHKKPLLHPGEVDNLKTPKAKSRTSVWEPEAKKQQGQKHCVWFIKSDQFLFKARLDGVWSNLGQWKMSLPWQGVEWDGVPPKPNHSRILLQVLKDAEIKTKDLMFSLYFFPSLALG